MSADAPCGRCGAPTEVVLREVEAESGPVAVRVEGRPLRRCGGGHEEVVTGDGDLAADALDRLPTAGRGLPFRPDRCDHCRTPLSLPGRWTTRSVSLLHPAGTGVVTVTFDIPMTRCPECATEQLPRTALDDVGAALEEALRHGPHVQG